MQQYKTREYLTSELLSNYWYDKNNMENPHVIENVFISDGVKFVTFKMLDLLSLEAENEDIALYNFDLFSNVRDFEQTLPLNEFIEKFTYEINSQF